MQEELHQLGEQRMLHAAGASPSNNIPSRTRSVTPPPPSNPVQHFVPKIPEDTTLYYSLVGRAGQVKVSSDGVVYVEDLIHGLTPIAADIDDERSEATRVKRSLELSRYGRSTCWIPTGTVLVAKNYLTKLQDSATIVKK